MSCALTEWTRIELCSVGISLSMLCILCCTLAHVIRPTTAVLFCPFILQTTILWPVLIWSQPPQSILGNGGGASHLGTHIKDRHLSHHIPWSVACCFSMGFLLLFPLKHPCTLHSLASNESSDCNIFSGATQSSVKSSDCVTNFPVQGGIAVDCVPLLRMWFSGLIQYKQRELEGGSPVVELSLAQPRTWFVRERYQTARLKFFTWQKQLFVYIPRSVLIYPKGTVRKKMLPRK